MSKANPLNEAWLTLPAQLRLALPCLIHAQSNISSIQMNFLSFHYSSFIPTRVVEEEREEEGEVRRTNRVQYWVGGSNLGDRSSSLSWKSGSEPCNVSNISPLSLGSAKRGKEG